MGLLEYFFERKNPGKVGTIESNMEPIDRISIPLLIAKLVFVLLILGGLLYITSGPNISVGNTKAGHVQYRIIWWLGRPSF